MREFTPEIFEGDGFPGVPRDPLAQRVYEELRHNCCDPSLPSLFELRQGSRVMTTKHQQGFALTQLLRPTDAPYPFSDGTTNFWVPEQALTQVAALP